ncbi:hypothetical protein [Vagococcus lutrae]|uniref:hypothetical protein n=1 Tax=Vagococcus lutrae TaxID=81947 RepID=UPI001443A18B|nr:hypothetical protein [Vagococcus lutrae]NKZ28138.1 hypothetical protein [Vagococcus lutrae]
MLELSIKLSEKYRKWKKKENIFFTGIFNEEVLSKVETDEDIDLIKEHINGAYALIIVLKDRVILLTDYLRTIPVFYEVTNDEIRIFDDVNDSSESYICNDKIIEYKNTGYIFGNETLKKNVYQTIRNSQTTILFSNGQISMRSNDNKICFSRKDEENFYKISDKLAQDLFDKFKNNIIYVPLSDGTDSKYILSLIKKSKLKNVICYTYGKNPRCSYAKKSKALAQEFGFEWKFVKYTKMKWKNLKKSNELNDYMKFAFQYSNYVHLQDFIAVKELMRPYTMKERENIIFMPGHTGSIGGGNLPAEIFEGESSDIKIKNFIKLKDFNLWNEGDKVLVKNTYLRHFFEHLLNKKDEERIREVQRFDLTERQSKLIVNSVRIYEFHGASWYLPLMDKRVTSYFENQQTIRLLNKTFYKKSVDKYYKKLSGNEDRNDYKVTVNSNKSYLRILAWKIIEQFTHDLSWFSLFSVKDRIRFFLSGNIETNIFMGLIANETLREMMKSNVRVTKKVN